MLRVKAEHMMVRFQAQLSWASPLFRLVWVGTAVAYGLAIAQLSLLNAGQFVILSVVAVGTLIEPLVGLVVSLFLGILWAWLRAELTLVHPLIAMPVLALTLASWLMHGAARREIRLRTPRLFFPLALFIAAAMLSLWDGVELSVYGLPELFKWLQILALFWFITDYADGRRLPWLVGGILAIGAFQALIGLWQFGLRGTGPDHFAILGDRFFRAYGTFEQPNPFAGFLGLVFPICVGIVLGVAMHWFQAKKPSLRPWLIGLLLLASAVMGAALLASWSRGGWLGMGAAILVMVVALPRRSWLGFGLVALLVVSVLGLQVLGLLPGSVSTRLTDFTEYARFEDVRGVGINDANFAVVERLAHWQAALNMWHSNFATGVGFGDFEPAYPVYRLINWPIALGHAHNYYLNVAAETGIVGLLAYVVLWVAVFWQTWRLTRYSCQPVWRRGLAIGLLGAWTHLSVHHLFDNLYVNNVHLFLGVMLGIVAVLANLAASERHLLRDGRQGSAHLRPSRNVDQ